MHQDFSCAPFKQLSMTSLQSVVQTDVSDQVAVKALLHDTLR